MYCKIINFNEQHPCTTTDIEVVLLPTTPTCTVNHLALTISGKYKPDLRLFNVSKSQQHSSTSASFQTENAYTACWAAVGFQGNINQRT
uniref:Uncharacterized protein n=1 Tax=Glossina palpalis gambiensis TaxID=67801 RepID=A0A1B0C5X9_9MUSC